MQLWCQVSKYERVIFMNYIIVILIIFIYVIIHYICLELEFRIHKDLFYDLYIRRTKYEEELRRMKDGKI